MDYTDRLEKDNVPESAHTIYPQSAKRPLYLIVAAKAVDMAWKWYDNLVEHEIFANEHSLREPRYELITKARENAEAAQVEYSAQWERWNKEVAAQLEVMG